MAPFPELPRTCESRSSRAQNVGEGIVSDGVCHVDDGKLREGSWSSSTGSDWESGSEWETTTEDEEMTVALDDGTSYMGAQFSAASTTDTGQKHSTRESRESRERVTRESRESYERVTIHFYAALFGLDAQPNHHTFERMIVHQIQNSYTLRTLNQTQLLMCTSTLITE